MTDYGKDISCLDGLRTGRFAKGRRLVAESCYRRLTTPKGMLRGGDEEQDFGIDLLEYLGASNPKQVAAALPAIIEAELLKDERVVEVTATCTLSNDGPAFALNIDVHVVTGEGPFNLAISVDEVSVNLLGIST